MNKFSFAALTSAAVVMLVSGNAMAGMENPETNHASYWGDNCTKTEMSGDIKTYTATENDVNKVIVKGGTDYTVYEDGNFTNLTAPVNPKNKNGTTYGISHVIVCKDVSVKPTEPKPTVVEDEDEVVTELPKIVTITPVNKVNTNGGKGGTITNTSDTNVENAGKGGASELPASLPKTGAETDLAAYFTLATGFAIIAALVGYKGALAIIAKRIS